MPNHNGSRPSAQTRDPRFPGRGQKYTKCPDCITRGAWDVSQRAAKLGSPRFGMAFKCGNDLCRGGWVPKDVRPQRMDESKIEYEARVFRDPYEQDVRGTARSPQRSSPDSRGRPVAGPSPA